MQNKEFHIKYGIHSNIPRCCVESFIRGTGRHQPGWGYIPCQLCLELSIRKSIHKCTPKCADYLVSKLGMTHEDVFWLLLNNFSQGVFASPTGKFFTLKEIKKS